MVWHINGCHSPMEPLGQLMAAGRPNWVLGHQMPASKALGQPSYTTEKGEDTARFTPSFPSLLPSLILSLLLPSLPDPNPCCSPLMEQVQRSRNKVNLTADRNNHTMYPLAVQLNKIRFLLNQSQWLFDSKLKGSRFDPLGSPSVSKRFHCTVCHF